MGAKAKARARARRKQRIQDGLAVLWLLVTVVAVVVTVIFSIVLCVFDYAAYNEVGIALVGWMVFSVIVLPIVGVGAEPQTDEDIRMERLERTIRDEGRRNRRHRRRWALTMLWFLD